MSSKGEMKILNIDWKRVR